MASKVTPIRLSPSQAETIVKDRARESANVIIGYHARARMSERDIFIDDVFRVLRTGSVDADPIRTDRGEWQCKIVKKIIGTRSVGVVTIILHKGKLFLKTVEWEDLR